MTICVSPGCATLPTFEFTAAAVGRLAGRDWLPGDVIRVCGPHAMDIYNTMGKDDPSEVAEWLRPEAADPPNTWQAIWRIPW